MTTRKILLVNWRDIRNPEAGGAEIYYHEIFRRLAAGGGYDVTVLSHAFPGAPPQEDADGLHVVRRGGKFLFNFTAMRYIRTHQQRYDLIIEDLNKLPFFTPLYVTKPRMHMVMHFFGSAIFQEAPWPMALYVYLMEKTIPLIYARDPFSVISRSTCREVARFCRHPEPVRVVEPGIDLGFFKPVRPKATPPFLLYIGRVKKYKNIQLIIRNMTALRQAVPDLRLVIAGAGDHTGPLQALTRSLSLDRVVSFPGFVSEESKRDLLSSAALIVNPSAKEGWGITNIEANACGTISVSSRVPGLMDSVDDGRTGLLFDYDNDADFREKTLRLLQDPPLRERMEKEARKFASRFEWDRLARDMGDFIGRIMPQ